MPVEQKLEEWKNKLLDLSYRNSLIKFHGTELNHLDLDDVNGIYEKILKGKEYSLTNNIDKIKQGENLSKISKKLQNKARMAKEEQGVHILYLSFGFLKWQDNYLKNVQQDELQSPLILIPIAISSSNGSYKINQLGDEVVINPTLTYYLKEYYKIDFSQISPVPENIDQLKGKEIKKYIDNCFAEIKKKINEKPAWQIEEKKAVISLLPFSRIEMRNDLEKRADKIKKHDVIRLLAGESNRTEQANHREEINEFCNGTYKHDINHPKDVYQIVDADSSQQDAIGLSKINASFVLQGPPGTGKSQTITNIIAEALAQGKKVLFVAEKKVALDVVYKRLDDNKLSDFCLFLGSDQENKKDLVESLWKNYESKRIIVKQEVDDNLDSLKKIRDQLNAYDEQLHQKIEPLNQSIFDANVELAELESVHDVDIGDVEKIIGEFDGFSKDKFTSFEECLNNYSTAISNLNVENDDYTKHPWYCCKLDDINLIERRRLKNYLDDFKDKIDNLINTLNDYEEIIKLKEIKIVDISKNIEMLCFCKTNASEYKFPVEWLAKSDKEFDDLENIANLRKEEKNKFREHLGEEIFHLSTEQINHRLSCFNFQIGEKLKPNSVWFNSDWSEKRQDWINWAQERIEKIISYKKEILERYENDIFDIECDQMLERFNLDYDNYDKWWKCWKKWFNNKYKDDCNSIRSRSRVPVETVSHADIIALLEKLVDYQSLLNEISENQDKLNAVLGGWYNGIDTSFEEMKQAMCMFDKIRDLYHVDDFNDDLNQLPDEVEDFSEVTNEDFVKYYRVLNEYKKFLEKEEDERGGYCQKYGSLYQGVQTNWDHVLECLRWAKQFKNYVDKYELTENFQKGVSDGSYSQTAGILADKMNSFNEESRESIQYFDDKIFKDILSCTIIELKNLIDRCYENIGRLDDWLSFKKSKQQIENKGLNIFVEKAKQKNIEVSELWNVFQKNIEYAWIDWAVREKKLNAIKDSKHPTEKHPTEKFCELDKEQWNFAIARIRKKVIDNFPENVNGDPGSEACTLRDEHNGKSRKTIRKFLNEIPTLLLKLKPCLMMSPLAVSRFLGDKIEFDMVIFDEASQIRTEEAIGAISRAKQVIIAGDSHQLPPTPYFRRLINGDGDMEENDDVTFTSVLDEARNLPQIMLKWHYRSRNESLIAFSNYKIYDSKLITFPTPCDNSNQDDGVEYIYVENAVYNRGERDNNNPKEADKVVSIIFDQINRHPDRSLGVIAFNNKQAVCIEDKIEEYRRDHQECDDFLNNEEKGFFVKSLEEVQGDERDTIICSIGYGRDQNGMLYMNFGPLNHKDYGYRRLNVAITRAKHSLKLVSSIKADDIRIGNNAAELSGLKLLKEYITFAEEGITSLEGYRERINENRNDNERTESPFERSVLDFLKQKKYKVEPQVGCSGYRIDMAVRHPETGRYVLAVECDGATYHSSRTARDRDRLRQEVLEEMGWKFHRIWSTDWIKNPQKEKERLLNAINSAINGDDAPV